MREDGQVKEAGMRLVDGNGIEAASILDSEVSLVLDGGAEPIALDSLSGCSEEPGPPHLSELHTSRDLASHQPHLIPMKGHSCGFDAKLRPLNQLVPAVTVRISRKFKTRTDSTRE
eukprot:g33897.t1